MKTIKKFMIILLMMALAQTGIIQAIEIPEPSQNYYVLDNADVLDEATVDKIITLNNELYENYQVQFVVVTVDFINDASLEDYAYQLFNKWEIGGSSNRGLLLVLDIGDDDYWMLQGRGLEDTLSSSYLGNVLYQYLEDDFVVGEYGSGVIKTMNAIKTKLDTSLKVNATTKTDENRGGFLSGLLIFVMIGCVVVLFIRKQRSKRYQQDTYTGNDYQPPYPSTNVNQTTNEYDETRMRELQRKEEELREREAQLRNREMGRQPNNNSLLKGLLLGSLLNSNRNTRNRSSGLFGGYNRSSNRSTNIFGSGLFSRGSSSNRTTHSSAPKSGQGGSSRGGGAGRHH